MNTAYKNANLARPSARQLKWQETEFYAQISYGMPVFTSTQYGSGLTPAAVFCPEAMDTDVWCEVVKSAGMRGIVLTVKHYDGFCLWPTEQTDYSVKASNWLDGEGDLVRMAADSCKRAGLKFGVHLSLWDRHEKTYGTGKAYDDFFCGVLEELLTNYGPLFTVWLDGMIGSDERRTQEFDFGRYYALIRSLQPDAAIAFMGPDVRWCGNDRGFTRADEWSPVPRRLGVDENGASAPSGGKKATTLMSPDIGSRKAIKDDTEFIWYPCEVAVPMRKHWFFDKEDKYSIRTKDKLLTLYYNTVGNNSCLMLGLSPDKRGEIPETDRQVLESLGKDLKTFFGANIVPGAETIEASSSAGGHGARNVAEKAPDAFWKPSPSDKKPTLEIRFEKDEYFDKLVLREHIANGQRIEAFEVFVLNEKGKWTEVYSGGTVGYKRICPLKPVKTKAVKITFPAFRDEMELSGVQIN